MNFADIITHIFSRLGDIIGGINNSLEGIQANNTLLKTNESRIDVLEEKIDRILAAVTITGIEDAEPNASGAAEEQE